MGKGELSIEVIIVAVISIVVLIVLLVIFHSTLSDAARKYLGIGEQATGELDGTMCTSILSDPPRKCTTDVCDEGWREVSGEFKDCKKEGGKRCCEYS